MGIDLEGAKHALGLWISKSDEGAKYWLGVFTEIRNRGVNDVCIVCTDWLSGFADAIETVGPKATVRTRVVHLIRNSIKYCGYQDRKAVTQTLRPIYTGWIQVVVATPRDKGG